MFSDTFVAAAAKEGDLVIEEAGSASRILAEAPPQRGGEVDLKDRQLERPLLDLSERNLLISESFPVSIRWRKSLTEGMLLLDLSERNLLISESFPLLTLWRNSLMEGLSRLPLSEPEGVLTSEEASWTELLPGPPQLSGVSRSGVVAGALRRRSRGGVLVRLLIEWIEPPLRFLFEKGGASGSAAAARI